ncbi:hypothetical protein LEP1GSC016_1088 [Leptospira borgpetersenii serovar Hardjo-bovis str. Sponselee]|uniref:Uncharacterized protein n=3 Tax=Leptospira borgpetersenii TaxID=174 RepID=A0A0S2IV44_LEPBO|nr:hypothetical protein LBBP_03316 [Leptospira borgpetersenii serovar Ballum]EKQ99401.1 hypothetical protein LEP1GSC121_1992 [Leptospira borgpetersenii serovar Castellonis str. 200801910]EMJ83518.1 hypothetical protein LEP1GSC016_1088 [Leptospira borgpetersenii serovar Hardjo-bovis str. Sponselee]EMK10462.1 hypothetical protein LEP1GSC066_0408 [Leptospira sp. serovar Kenya str. Sh9]EMO09215.1 hypothetical protein LEP1GSC137_2662 [Leptospira borgpetersenii str. Noumea 25]EMO62214.1 hypothetical
MLQSESTRIWPYKGPNRNLKRKSITTVRNKTNSKVLMVNRPK